MEFEVRYVSGIKKPFKVDITTLEELRDFAKSVNEELLIKFKGVTSNAWYPHGELGEDEKEIENIKKLSEEQEILIYDNYME